VKKAQAKATTKMDSLCS